jgi:hypothetical protein
MFRGFLAGSVALAIGYALLSNDSTAARAQQATTWWVSGLHRLLSSDVAGIPQLLSASPSVGRKLTPGSDTTPAPAPLPGKGQITV